MPSTANNRANRAQRLYKTTRATLQSIAGDSENTMDHRIMRGCDLDQSKSEQGADDTVVLDAVGYKRSHFLHGLERVAHRDERIDRR